VLSDRFRNVDLHEVQENRTKTMYLSFIYKIAMHCNCNCNSLFTSFLSHQVFHIDTRAFRSLLHIVYALCKALAVRAVVICCITDITLSQ
jgi:hypothetical protein